MGAEERGGAELLRALSASRIASLMDVSKDSFKDTWPLRMDVSRQRVRAWREELESKALDSCPGRV